jgi:parallel beta-helix repeat protein
LILKSKSSTYVLNNDIFENKSGGIRVGVNYSASVLIDGNIIRNNTGPGIFVMNADEQLTEENKLLVHLI